MENLKPGSGNCSCGVDSQLDQYMDTLNNMDKI